tara:strand:+ start:871 stop:3789 length:2919 start_codon:yes stop_codon:yes gene_type:complete
MAGYTRQSSASIVNGTSITAAPLNAEFNQLLAAFHATTGHTHTGATGNGTKIPLATSVSGFLPIANGGSGGKNNFTATSVPGVGDDSGDSYAIGSMWTNTSTDRVYICTDSSSGAAVWRELVQVTSLNAILPVSNNSVDLGSSGTRFKDLFLSGASTVAGNSAVVGTLTLTGSTALNSTLTVAGVTALNGGLTMDSNKFTVANGTGNTAIAGLLAVTGATALNGGLTMDTNAFTVANTSGNVATAGTLAVAGTSAFTGAITADAGVVVDNITIDGTEIDLSSGDLTIDVAGDILLNADGGDIFLQDGSATFGSLTNTGGNLIIKSGTTTAATFAGANVDLAGTLDVTGAGTFDSTLAVTGVLSPATHVDMPDNAKIKVGTGDDLEISHDGTNSFIANKTGILKVSTETSGGAVLIGHTTSEVTIGDNLTVAGDLTVQGTQTVVNSVIMNAQNAVVFEGATADAHETTLTIVDPTADRTINLPNQSGTLPLLAAASNATISATPAELSILDGDTSAVSTTLADADRVVVNDAGTMKQVAMSDINNYMQTNLNTQANLTTVGALNTGSITSGFGAIDNGSSAITTTGTMNFGSLSDGTITVTAFVDEDNMSSNSATLVPTQQSVKAYVDTVSGTSNNVTGLTASGAELNILDGATVTTAEVNILDGSATTQATVTLVATDGVVISDADVMKQALVSDFDTFMASTTKTLTNKTLTNPVLDGSILTASNAALNLAPNGTGKVVVKGNSNSAAIVFNCESNSHGQTVQAQPHSASATNTMLLPEGSSSTLLSRVSTDTLTNKTLTSPKINENVAVTSTATELNILDGVTSTTAELNILDGVTSTTAELNILDGVTSTAAELNLVDGLVGIVAKTSATGSALLPTGNTAQRDGSPTTGAFRFNSTLTAFEGYNGSAWGSVGGGATGGVGNEMFYENDQAVSASYTIPANRNAMTTGPITVNNGVTVTISDGSRLVVI